MSTLKVTNIEATGSTDQVSSDTLLNSPKLWAEINGAAIPAITNSYNMSSVGDNGVGKYQVNINNDLAATQYAAICSHVSATPTADQNAGIDTSTAKTAGIFSVYVHSSASLNDDDVDVVVVGTVLA